MFRRIIYRSKISNDVDAAQIRQLSSQAKAANAARDIQGALIAINRYFYQVLEGETTTLTPLLQKIKSDPRHHDFTLLQDTQIRARRFAGWDMSLILSPSPDLESCIAQINQAFDSDNASEETCQRLCEGLVYIILGAVDAEAASF